MYVAEIVAQISISNGTLLPKTYDYIPIRVIAANNFKELHERLMKYYMKSQGYFRGDDMYREIMHGHIGNWMHSMGNRLTVTQELFVRVGTGDADTAVPTDEITGLVCPEQRYMQLTIGFLDGMESAMELVSEVHAKIEQRYEFKNQDANIYNLAN